MKKVCIAADSTCDLSPELVARYQIPILPLHIILEDEDHRDGVDITPDEIYAWSDAHKQTPHTSAFSPEEASAFIRSCLADAEEMVFFDISASMSSSADVMFATAGEMGLREKVHVVDAKNLSTGIGLQILYACDLAAEGLDGGEIVRRIEAMQDDVRASFVVDTLVYLHRGGRCSGLAAMLGATLRLHPRIFVEGGKMGVGKKYRGKMDRVILSYVKDMEEDLLHAKTDRIFITHSGCEQAVIDSVREYLESLNRFEEILITRAGGVITSHCGPGTLGVLFVMEK